MVYCPRAGWQFLISEGNGKLLSFFLDIKAVRKKKLVLFAPQVFCVNLWWCLFQCQFKKSFYSSWIFNGNKKCSAEKQLSPSVWFSLFLHCEVKRSKGRDITLRKKKQPRFSLFYVSYEAANALSHAFWWRRNKQEEHKECKMLILQLNGLQNVLTQPLQDWQAFLFG